MSAICLRTDKRWVGLQQGVVFTTYYISINIYHNLIKSLKKNLNENFKIVNISVYDNVILFICEAFSVSDKEDLKNITKYTIFFRLTTQI